jgi:hypothetical protein
MASDIILKEGEAGVGFFISGILPSYQQQMPSLGLLPPVALSHIYRQANT